MTARDANVAHLLAESGSCALASTAAVVVPAGTPTLSPPHTWIDGSEGSTVPSYASPNPPCQNEDLRVDDRLLFTACVSIPDGTVLASRTCSEAYEAKDIERGACFLRLLLGTGQSFFLSAAATSARQRVFSRVKCGSSSRACELQCEFETGSDGLRRARVTALCLRSAFGPAARPFSAAFFTTKHSPSCALTHIDYASVPLIGHLPTDVIGRSLLSFVYAPDVHIVRQAHIDLHTESGRVVRSAAPIRLVAFNGALLTVESEWSAFVSPWTHRIEMVVARHRVIDAPVGNADVMCAPAADYKPQTLPPALVRTFEEELKGIMSKPVVQRPQPVFAAQSDTKMATMHAGALTSYHQLVGLNPTAFLPAQRPDLSAYIDRIIENLVINGSSSPQAQLTSISAPATPSSVSSPSEQHVLTHQQINCIDKVHRFIKSLDEAHVEREAPVVENLSNAPQSLRLTEQTLQEHTRRWEEQCISTWRYRLASKRHSNQSNEEYRPAAKTPRTASPRSFGRRSPRWTNPRPLPPNPSPPCGTAYQVTSTPLPDDPGSRQTTPRPPTSVIRPTGLSSSLSPKLVAPQCH